MLDPRRATPADVDAVRNLTRAAYARWTPIIGREPRPMTADYARAIECHIIDLHRVEGVLAALIEMRREPDHLLVVNIAVAPPFQGQGLGRALLAHAESVATACGLDLIRLYTNALMVDNVRLYLQLGYRVDREEPWMGGSIVHMTKTLRTV